MRMYRERVGICRSSVFKVYSLRFPGLVGSIERPGFKALGCRVQGFRIEGLGSGGV